MRRVTVPDVVPYYSGPWKGMRQHTATVTDRKDFLELILNGYLRDADQAPIVAGRPGMTLIGVAGSIHQLGSGGARTGQLLHHFTTLAGAEHRVAICGGKFYTYDVAADTFTETLSAANLSGASITLSTTARCHAVVFDDLLVISDGVNTPWAWDGTSGAGLTKLTNCPVLYGQPWVKSNKLMGIKGSSTAARISIVWSEEGQVNTGYEAGGYTNIWDVIQTNSSIFVAGAATNDQIVLARQNSMTRILGDVTTDFQTTATDEAVHTYVGTLSPSGMLVHLDTVYVFTNDGRILKVAPGGAAQEIAIGAREYLASHRTTKFSLVDAVIWDAGDYGEYLVWSVVGATADHPNTLIVVDSRTDELAGIWNGWVQHRMGTWKNANGEPVLVHIGGSTATTVDEGWVYLHGQPGGTVWDDGFQAGSATITHTVTTHALGFDERSEKYWDIAYLSMLLPTTVSGLGVQTKTPYGTGTPLAGASLTGGGSLWGAFLWGSGTWGAAAAERRVPIGLDTHGRWLHLTATHQTAGEQFAIQAIQVTGQSATMAPDVT